MFWRLISFKIYLKNNGFQKKNTKEEYEIMKCTPIYECTTIHPSYWYCTFFSRRYWLRQWVTHNSRNASRHVFSINLIESLSRRRFCQHGRQPEVSQPFSFEINNGSHSAFTFVISNENGWRHHLPSITTRFTSGWRPCWQKRRWLKLSNDKYSPLDISELLNVSYFLNPRFITEYIFTSVKVPIVKN